MVNINHQQWQYFIWEIEIPLIFAILSVFSVFPSKLTQHGWFKRISHTSVAFVVIFLLIPTQHPLQVIKYRMTASQHDISAV